MFLFDVLHLLNEFHVFTSPIKTFISMGVIFILSEVLCWHVAWSVKCICLFQPSRNSIKTLRTSNETTKLWWNRYYIYFVNKNSNESDSTISSTLEIIYCHGAGGYHYIIMFTNHITIITILVSIFIMTMAHICFCNFFLLLRCSYIWRQFQNQIDMS